MTTGLQAMAELALDALALRSIAALEAADVPVLLMKGPVTRDWLYPGSAAHPYTDVDLLVAPEDEASAAAVLRLLGLRDLHAGMLGLYRPRSERAWGGPEGIVDLHIGLVGIPSDCWAQAWRRFDATAEPFPLRGRVVRVMSGRARTLHVALHAAQRASGSKAVADLDVAIRAVPPAVWAEAAELATELRATAAFSAGLDRIEPGRELLNALGIQQTVTVLSVLHARGARSEALTVADALTERRARWRSLLQVEDPSVPTRRVRYLRLAALARLPRGVFQFLGAVLVVRRTTRRRRA